MKIDLCKLFGVEEGEEFRIKYENFKDNKLIYKVNNGLRCKVYGSDFIRSDLRLNDLLYVKEIIKLSKKKQFTDDELCILRNIDKKYKWIARDIKNEDDEEFECGLLIYENKPYKHHLRGEWYKQYDYENIGSLNAYSHLFQSIKYEDEEPVFIDDHVER